MPWFAAVCPGGDTCIADYTVATYTNLTASGFRLLVRRTVDRTASWALKQGTRTLRSGTFVDDFADISRLAAGTDYTVEITVWDSIEGRGRVDIQSAVWSFPVRTLSANELSSVVHIEGFKVGDQATAVMLIRAPEMDATSENRTLPRILWQRVGGSQIEFRELDVYPIADVLGGHALAIVTGLPGAAGDYILEASSRPGETPTTEGYRLS